MKTIIATDISKLKVERIECTNSGNTVCKRLSSTFFGGGGMAIVTIPNPVIGQVYEQKSIMVPYGYGVNWETEYTKLLNEIK